MLSPPVPPAFRENFANSRLRRAAFVQPVDLRGVKNGIRIAIRIDEVCKEKRTMLKIQRSSKEEVVFTLSGRIEAEGLAELQGIIGLEKTDQPLVLDLEDVTLVGRETVKFLVHCEADKITLKNCPAYIREWISKERDGAAAR
jgi:hypothetical protein